MKKILTFFSLFGSMTTLLCCALPVTLVSIGMGATFASLTSNMPWIIWLTSKKEWLFAITFILLVVSYFLMKKSETLSCPIDPEKREVCETSKGVSKKLYWFTVIVYLIGFSFSYLIPRLMY